MNFQFCIYKYFPVFIKLYCMVLRVFYYFGSFLIVFFCIINSLFRVNFNFNHYVQNNMYIFIIMPKTYFNMLLF